MALITLSLILKIAHCFFERNHDEGFYCHTGSTAIRHCVIINNSGQGISCREDSTPTIAECRISNNLDDGILCYSSNAMIGECVITYNLGSGIVCIECDPDIINCRIIGNVHNGLSIFRSNPIIQNCTIIANLRHGVRCSSFSIPTFNNCILWGSVKGEINYDSENSEPTFDFCDIQGGWWGPGDNNIDDDPLLTPDGHLCNGSPCIDWCPNGPDIDIDGETRPYPAKYKYDIGADEYIDSDEDGLPDWWEMHYFGSETVPEALGDDDLDTLTNLWEYENGTNPVDPDTDSDGRNDNSEITDDTNPIHPDNIEMTYYVNTSIGSDLYDGLSASWNGLNGPKATIQAGIDAAINGWSYTVEVAEGTYTGMGNKNIDFKAMDIAVISQEGPETTTIDCENDGGGFYFHLNESNESLLEGFTICNANFSAVFCEYASNPTIIDCIICNNNASGICCRNGSEPIISNCIITSNNSHGIRCEYNSSPSVINCIITENFLTSGIKGGGGIHCFRESNPVLTNCTIARNISTILDGGGVYCGADTAPEMTNCIIWGNIPDEICTKDLSSPILNYCDIRGGWSGIGGNNIDMNPLLTPDGHLQADSPCIDFCPNGPEIDIDGESRPFHEAESYDIGADEFKDTDGDQLPDWWELLYFGSPTAGTADSDDDLDDLTNQGEYTSGTDPHHPDTDGDGRNDGREVIDQSNPLHPDNAEKAYYVDSPTGNDAYDGLAPEWNGIHGPKATIQAGIDATITGWGYIVQVADGVYTGEGNRAIVFDGKAITLRSEKGPEYTTIDVQASPSLKKHAFYLKKGEDNDSVIEGFTITNSYALTGGAIACLNHSNPTIRNCIITGNTSARDGGGAIFISQSSPVVQNCIITNNTAESEGGGGIHCESSSSPIIENCIIKNNTTDDSGGGIYYYCCFSTENKTQIIDCAIEGNTATKCGGGICSEYSDIIVRGCHFADNSAGEKGGGIFCLDRITNETRSIIDSSIVDNNSANDYGGGIYYRVGYDTNDSSFEEPPDHPGVTSLGEDVSCAIISNCMITANSAGIKGGGMNCAGSNLRILNCTLSANLTTESGGGIYLLPSDIMVTNCILWGDYPDEVDVDNPDWHPPILEYCDVQGGWPGVGNIDADPLFVSGLEHDYYLSQTAAGQGENSPCVDTGSDTAQSLGMNRLSTRTDEVRDTGIVDMGYHSYALAIDSINRTEDDITVRWNARPGVSYIFEWSDDLSTWHAFSVGETGELIHYDGALEPQIYYRVRKE